MKSYYPEINKLQQWIEIFSAIVGLLYIPKVIKTKWIWFVVYLVILSISDFFSKDIIEAFSFDGHIYRNYYILPLQFVFFYWLYAIMSFKSYKLFIAALLVYFLSLWFESFFKYKIEILSSFSYVVGCLIFQIFVFLEFKKQIVSDSILKYYHQKMFYINIGVLVLYIGTMPFWGLYNWIKNEDDLWNISYLYFLISNCTMYLLFIASFIWGETD
jgi:hypothetical protein